MCFSKNIIMHMRKYAMTKVSGVRATLGIQHAMNAAGLGRTSTLNGGEINGWIEANYYRSHGFGVKQDKRQGELDWSVVVSGRPHLRYEESRYFEDDEVLTSNDPQNTEVLYPKIKKVFESLGMTVHQVEYTGHQTMWDDDVSYNIRTNHPEWLEAYSPSNLAQRITEPRLVSARIVETSVSKVRSLTALPMYQIGDKESRDQYSRYPTMLPNQFGLTKEALQILIDNVNSMSTHTPSLAGAVRFVGDVLHLNLGFDQTVRPQTITNAWGDDVEIYLWPRANVELEHKYTPACPMLIGGEMVISPDFPLLDLQFGGDGPWTIERPARSMTP
jgi:hypothetical protein